MFAVVVTIKVATGGMEAFMPMMLSNATTSLADEQGCRRFDVCTDPDRPDEVVLYELYDTPEAFQAHLASSHYAVFDTAAAPLIASKTVATFSEVHS